MFQYLNWASELVGISPVARLLAIRFANYATYAGDAPSENEPACETSLAKALEWIGCEEGELRAAMEELRENGVRDLKIEAGKIFYSLPPVEHHDFNPVAPRTDAEIWLYVIQAAATVCKIGISRFPEYRLANLQAGSPTVPLTMIWKAKGAASKIRKAERGAHEVFAAQAAGNEWFNLSASWAVAVAKDQLEKVGIIA